MLHVFTRLSSTLAVIMFGATLLVGCGSATRSATTTSSYTATPHIAAVSIPQGHQLFVPFIVAVQPNTVVTWQNNDTVSHTIMTTWDQSPFLNPQAFSLVAPARQKVSFTFTRPGVYDYFDNTQAKWIDGDHRVRANRGVPHYPLAREGVVWVQGYIPDLPSSATNVIPNGKDEFATDFLAIRPGSRVSWHNEDTDKHVISLVNGWSVPINTTDLGSFQINGTKAALPNGGTAAVTFSTPGLYYYYYYYYCSTHADVNTTWHRAQAHTNASEAPIPMEGFALVVGS